MHGQLIRFVKIVQLITAVLLASESIPFTYSSESNMQPVKNSFTDLHQKYLLHGDIRRWVNVQLGRKWKGDCRGLKNVFGFLTN